MAIEDNIAQVRSKLDMISQYNNMILNNNFEPDTITDMKGNAKNICDGIETEVAAIKVEINNWS